MISGESVYHSWETVPYSDHDLEITIYAYETDRKEEVQMTFGVDMHDYGRYTLYLGGTAVGCTNRAEIADKATQYAIGQLTSSYVSWREFAAGYPHYSGGLMYGITRIDDEDTANRIIGEFPALWAAFVEGERVGRNELRLDTLAAINAMIDAVESAGGEW